MSFLSGKTPGGFFLRELLGFLSERSVSDVQLGCPGLEGSPKDQCGECHHRTLMTQVQAHRVSAPGQAPEGGLSDQEPQRRTEPGVTAPRRPSRVLRQGP